MLPLLDLHGTPRLEFHVAVMEVSSDVNCRQQFKVSNSMAQAKACVTLLVRSTVLIEL
jgi:hypothetical protein